MGVVVKAIATANPNIVSKWVLSAKTNAKHVSPLGKVVVVIYNVNHIIVIRVIIGSIIINASSL